MITPDSINLNLSDREVSDGSLQESINLQWRDGANKPIPYRLLSDINVDGFSNIIAHKVGDESQINIIGFWTDILGNNQLYWIGRIDDGVYTDLKDGSYPLISSEITYSEGLSFTILNGIVYFMSRDNEFYFSLFFEESDNTYETTNMYSWKDLPLPFSIGGDTQSFTNGQDYINIGIVLIRYTFVLDTGEEVMHSPITPFLIKKLSSGGNIHSVINIGITTGTSTENDEYVKNYDQIKVYASIPFFDSELSSEIGLNELEGRIKQQANGVFYNIKTFSIEEGFGFGNTQYVILNQGDYDMTGGVYDGELISLDTIAAGEVMVVDNFSHHKIFGKIGSFNGRLIIESPETILSKGIARSILNITTSSSSPGSESATQSSRVSTEDGILTINRTDVGGFFFYSKYNIDSTKSIISYPDNRASSLYISSTVYLGTTKYYKFALEKSEYNNESLCLNFNSLIYTPAIVDEIDYSVRLNNSKSEIEIFNTNDNRYTSENRIQFSEVGEFGVFPALNSYRVGEGKIVFVGANRVNPENADVVAPLIIGTSDGIYTLNLDLTGASLVNSITKAVNLPAISDETLEIEGDLIFVSDKGLMVINNGNVINLTNKVFPAQGNGDFPSPNTVYPNYNECLVAPGGSSYINPSSFAIDDIVSYMRGAIFAYDGRRNNIWCSNPDYNYSLIYSTELGKWSMSSIVYDEKVELFSFVEDEDGKQFYSRFMVKGIEKSNISQWSDQLIILSSENDTASVTYHLLSRPFKLGSPDVFKKIVRVISRCELIRETGEDGIISFGVWGKQDLNKRSTSIPIVSISDNSSFKNNVRQDVPIGSRKGKYKAITILQSGVVSPESSIDGYDFSVVPVDDKFMR